MVETLTAVLGAVMLAPFAILAAVWVVAAIYAIRWKILEAVWFCVVIVAFTGALMLFVKYGVPAYVNGWGSVLELVHGPR